MIEEGRGSFRIKNIDEFLDFNYDDFEVGRDIDLEGMVKERRVRTMVKIGIALGLMSVFLLTGFHYGLFLLVLKCYPVTSVWDVVVMFFGAVVMFGCGVGVVICLTFIKFACEQLGW